MASSSNSLIWLFLPASRLIDQATTMVTAGGAPIHACSETIVLSLTMIPTLSMMLGIIPTLNCQTLNPFIMAQGMPCPKSLSALSPYECPRGGGVSFEVTLRTHKQAMLQESRKVKPSHCLIVRPWQISARCVAKL